MVKVQVLMVKVADSNREVAVVLKLVRMRALPVSMSLQPQKFICMSDDSIVQYSTV